MAGRKLHNFWDEGDFEPVNDVDKSGRKRVVAICKVCSAITKNTTKTRLVAHR